MPLNLKGIWDKVRSVATTESAPSKTPPRHGKLLTESEAAEFLQPFLLHKNAVQWLASDRQQNPVISFLLINGQPHYVQDDLLEFIDRLIKPAKMYFVDGVPAGIDRRNGQDRRNGTDRRASAERQLQANIERRSFERPDRRLRGGLDRRGTAHAA